MRALVGHPDRAGGLQGLGLESFGILLEFLIYLCERLAVPTSREGAGGVSATVWAQAIAYLCVLSVADGGSDQPEGPRRRIHLEQSSLDI